MTYGGLCGFEEEDYRQSCLRGRRFTSAEKASADKQFHKTSVFLAGDVKKKYSESSVDRPMSKSLSTASHAPTMVTEYASAQGRAAGEVTGAASNHGYNVLNGKTVLKKTRESKLAFPGPEPPASSKPESVLLPIINSSSVGSSYDERVMSGGLNQYKNAAEALKPIGNYPATSLISGSDKDGLGNEYCSHRLYKQEMRKHTRPVLGPKDKTIKPVTSSQVYGWFPRDGYLKVSKSYERRFCPETRFAVSLSLGPRHKNGYGGQGTL